MDLHEIGDLLEKIAVHYPAFGKQISKDGKMNKAVAEEWLRIIGYLSYEDAINRLDAYMDNDENKKAPMAADFRKVKMKKALDIYHAPITHQWKVIRGRLFDEEDREYVVDPTDELPFYYDREGNICQGKIIRFRRTNYAKSQ